MQITRHARVVLQVRIFKRKSPSGYDCHVHGRYYNSDWHTVSPRRDARVSTFMPAMHHYQSGFPGIGAFKLEEEGQASRCQGQRGPPPEIC